MGGALVALNLDWSVVDLWAVEQGMPREHARDLLYFLRDAAEGIENELLNPKK
jgi:hypothetical protein